MRGGGGTWQLHRNVCTVSQEVQVRTQMQSLQTSHRDTEATSHSLNTGGTVHKRERTNVHTSLNVGLTSSQALHEIYADTCNDTGRGPWVLLQPPNRRTETNKNVGVQQKVVQRFGCRTPRKIQ